MCVSQVSLRPLLVNCKTLIRHGCGSESWNCFGSISANRFALVDTHTHTQRTKRGRGREGPQSASPIGPPATRGADRAAAELQRSQGDLTPRTAALLAPTPLPALSASMCVGCFAYPRVSTGRLKRRCSVRRIDHRPLLSSSCGSALPPCVVALGWVWSVRQAGGLWGASSS